MRDTPNAIPHDSLTLQAVSEALGIGYHALYHYIRRHQVPVQWSGKRLLVRLDDLAEMRVPLRYVYAIRWPEERTEPDAQAGGQS